MASCSAPAAAATPYFPPELIPAVARRLTSLQDFFALRASCRAYRAVLPLTPSNLASQAPLLLLVPDHQSTKSPALFHLHLRRLLRFRFPRACQDSSRHFFSLGCRVLIHDYLREPRRRELRMVHLVTGEQICLPNPACEFNNFLLSGELLVNWGYFSDKIGFYRLGAADWSVTSIKGPYVLDRMICVKGTIYALVSTGYAFDNPIYLLAAVNLSDNSSSAELVFLGDALSARTVHLCPGTELCLSLAECRGELILIVAMEFNPMAYHVFCWKYGEDKWVRITSLGGCALFFATYYFVGSLGPDHPGIRKDCIYFSEEGLWSEYSSVDGSFRRSDVVNPGVELQEGFRSSTWVFPSMC